MIGLPTLYSQTAEEEEQQQKTKQVPSCEAKACGDEKGCDEGCPCGEIGSEDDEHDHCEDCCDHEPGFMHVSDPTDPVTQICAKINEDLEKWEETGTLNEENLQDALKMFEEALKMTSKHMDALLGKAYVQGELGLTEQATETLLQALSIEPRDIRVQTMLAEVGEFADEDDARDLEVIEKYMTEDGNPTPKFKSALTEIFDRYATGTDPKKKAITKTGMNKFHDFVNGGPLSQEATAYLFSGEWPLNAEGNLTLEGFIEFYLNQTFADPGETISDMRTLGYDLNLERIPPITTNTKDESNSTSSSAEPSS